MNAEPTKSPGHEPSETHQYATFTVARHLLGLNVLEVQEVLRGQSMTRVPLAPPVVEGLINLRGQIVPALDMRRVLGLPSEPKQARVISGVSNEMKEADNLDPEPGAVSVVVRSPQGAISLQVDEIEDVIDLNSDSFEPPPPNIDAAMRPLFKGVHKLDGRLLLVLDTEQTLQAGIPTERN